MNLLKISFQVGLRAALSLASLLLVLLVLLIAAGSLVREARLTDRLFGEVLIEYLSEFAFMSFVAFIVGIIFAAIAYGLTRLFGRRIYDARRYVLYSTLLGGFIGFLLVVYIHLQKKAFLPEDLLYAGVLALWFAFIGNRFAALDLIARRKKKEESPAS